MAIRDWLHPLFLMPAGISAVAIFIASYAIYLHPDFNTIFLASMAYLLAGLSFLWGYMQFIRESSSGLE